MNPRVLDIIEIIDTIAPFRLAEEWDNVGLQVGDPAAPVSRIMVSLDPGNEAIEAAVAAQCQLLLTHHPLIFRPLQTINFADPSGALIGKALRNSLSIVSLHTNYDIAEGGVNDLLAARLGVVSPVPLSVNEIESLVKLAVFVPKGYEETVSQALFRFSGNIGNYGECSFRVEGQGTFTPHEGAAPFIGSIGTREYAEETRIEVLLRKTDVEAALAELMSVHPYEEPAVDLYPLLNMGARKGLGRIGMLKEPLSLEQFVARIKEEFAVEGLRYVGDGSRSLERVALCGGSGSSLLREAHSQGADVLVTGDVKYHDAHEALALGVALVDLGHFASELPMVEGLVSRLKSELRARDFVAELMVCTGEKDPFRYR
ncbi:MAG: Nif3-like dinuclear metal center hexameric protein [Deltaproteobacteria bacterium]|nr:Nif3-like dinuclear metal center hexameric protein [Deltaproteobacteria bacterium]MRR58457.1 Nif3-like dinuclear metal center hexameric protein [Deltaproteobacteria bacterium]TLN02658.1 MAG: Nif3-like dinuclear metal center hexameric protein [bacterium]